MYEKEYIYMYVSLLPTKKRGGGAWKNKERDLKRDRLTWCPCAGYILIFLREAGKWCLEPKYH